MEGEGPGPSSDAGKDRTRTFRSSGCPGGTTPSPLLGDDADRMVLVWSISSSPMQIVGGLCRTMGWPLGLAEVVLLNRAPNRRTINLGVGSCTLAEEAPSDAREEKSQKASGEGELQ